MKRAETVSKARMFRRLIRKQRESELFDAPQTLKFSRVDEPNEKFSFVRVRFQTDNIVNRIAVDFFRQGFLRKKIVQSSNFSLNIFKKAQTEV